MKDFQNQQGGILAFLFGAIGIMALISLGAFQFMSGAATGADDGVKTINARNAMNMNLQGMTARAYRLISDCDADGTFEAMPFLPSASAPTNGGVLPMNSGATLTDPWGTRYGYCAWDQGSTIGDAACGGGTGYLSGSSLQTPGLVQSLTTMAIVSAGANRTFETTCNNYVDGTTDVITTGGDDIVHRYSYRQASHATSNRWGETVAASSCGDLTASMTLDRTLAPFAQESSLQPTNVSATFEMTIELPTTLSDSIILESGATGRGMGIWLEGNDIVFAAGDGTVSVTDADTVKIRTDVSGLIGQEIVLTAAVDPLNGQLALYIDGCHTVSGETTDATNLSADNWAGTNDVGYGTKATGIRTDMPTVNFSGTLVSNMNFYSGELPDGFPNAPSGGGGSGGGGSIPQGDTSATVTIASNTQLRCSEWSMFDEHHFCQFEISIDGGSNFIEGGLICTVPFSGPGSERDPDVYHDVLGNDVICPAACGGGMNSGNYYTRFNDASTHFFEDDYTVTPTGAQSCLYALERVSCNCW